MERSPVSWCVGEILAGTYVTLATILIITLGKDTPPSLQKLIMGGTFGVALTLVLFAGSERFTAYAMYVLCEGSLIKNGSERLYQIAHHKMIKSATALFFNGALCN